MKFIKLGEERCTNAREEAKNVCVEIDDLEVLQTPERYLSCQIHILTRYELIF